MSIQKQLNQIAINMLPKTKKALIEHPEKKWNVIQNISNAKKCLDDQTIEELRAFDVKQEKYVLS